VLHFVVVKTWVGTFETLEERCGCRVRHQTWAHYLAGNTKCLGDVKAFEGEQVHDQETLYI
jgi:hypothetical protein